MFTKVRLLLSTVLVAGTLGLAMGSATTASATPCYDAHRAKFQRLVANDGLSSNACPQVEAGTADEVVPASDSSDAQVPVATLELETSSCEPAETISITGDPGIYVDPQHRGPNVPKPV